MKQRRIGAWFMLSVVVVALATIEGTAAADGKPRGGDLSARLKGTNELPPADLDGAGRAKVELKVSSGELCFKIQFRDTGTPNRGHIHIGDAATNGDIVVPLFELQADPTDPRHDTLEDDRALEDCVPADAEILAAIKADPGNFYCNLHNARFPAGAIRGQLED